MTDNQTQPDDEQENSGQELSKISNNEQDKSTESGGDRRPGDDDAICKKETLGQLKHLAACVALDALSTKKADSMAYIYDIMLRHMGEDSSTGAASPSDNDVLALYRENPAAFKLIEPFLTKGQIDLIIRHATGDQ